MTDSTPDLRLDAHLFICTNTKQTGASCGAKGSAALRDQLKDWAAKDHPEWRGRVRVNAAGCLGQCARGIAAVVYPQAEWFTGLTQDDGPRMKGVLEGVMKDIAEPSTQRKSF
ncbi:MAG: hypothetical protein RIQ81_2620 [Pseudomonadota bacterium]